MTVNKNISDFLDIEHTPVVYEEKKQEIKNIEVEQKPDDSDKDEDYVLVRQTLRNLINKGNEAIEDMSFIAKQNESARGYEVVANLIKTVGETSKDLYNIQKLKKELKEPEGNKKLDETNINVDKAVFVGSTAELLRTLKEEKNTKLIEGEANNV